MSNTNSNNYPLRIENINIEEDTLSFTVLNDTNNTCNIYLNDNLIKSTSESNSNIRLDLSDYFIGKVNIRVESEDKFIIKTVDRDLSTFFSNLNKTLRGLDGYYFLVNDRNYEMYLHYDRNFEYNLDIERFRESITSKKNFLESRDINYGLFVVPDKSITLRSKLPFKTDLPYRHVDCLGDILYDLGEVISAEDASKTDTHISSKSSLKIVSYITSKLSDSDFDNIYSKLRSVTHLVDNQFSGDLFKDKNWSYDRDEEFHENKTVTVKKLVLDCPAKRIPLKDIPSEFRYMSRRESLYYVNENSITDKRAIILHDSSGLVLINALTAYYREVFFTWDHWFFNDELVEWFKPDDVVEVRTERFLDNPQYQLVTKGYFANYPISTELKYFNVDKKELKAQILIKDYRQLPVKTEIKTFLDDKLISVENSDKYNYHFSYPMNSQENGKHCIRFEIKSRFKRREVVKDFILEDSLEEYFKDLKFTFKGVGDHFFIVNDNSNELRQHYDKMYNSKFNRKHFIQSHSSKKSYLENMKINYDTFIIPDKSVVLSEYIPFKQDQVYRHVDSLANYVVDLISVVEEEDYLLNDTCISEEAGINVVSYILSRNNDETMESIKEKILSKVLLVDTNHRGNLFTNKSWSYPSKEDLHDKYYEICTKTITLKDDVIEVDVDDIPEMFRKFSKSSALYLKNPDSITCKKAVVLCDDSIKSLIPSLICYYREVFFYEDLWYFNRELIEWFKPDDVLEIRSERTLENAQYQLVSIEENYVIPVTRKINKFEYVDNKLRINIEYYNLRHMPVDSTCTIRVDDNILDSVEINGLLSVCYELESGEHLVEVMLEASSTSKANVYKKVVGRG